MSAGQAVNGDSPRHSTHEVNGKSPDGPSTNPSAFLAPSDFLPRLPPSTDTPTILDPQGADESSTTPPAKATVDAQGRVLHSRSCVTCRKRKVKCDKVHPCGNCRKAHIECIIPAPGRAPRKTKKIVDGRDKELLERLRRLEGVVKGLGVEVPGTEIGKELNQKEQETLPQERATSRDEILVENSAERTINDQAESRSKAQWVEEQQGGHFENRFGRLVVNEGKSRYVNNSFWANLSYEVEDLKGILNQSSDEEDPLEASPGTNTQQVTHSHHGFIFGASSHGGDLLNLHPYPDQIEVYWNIYKERVDPLAKVLHIPSLESTVLRAASQLTSLSRGFECLLFAIYYSATTSLNTEDCLQQLGEEKAVLLSRYRFAVEQALARANFLTTEEMVVLQAFVLFLTCLRRNNDARVIWTLMGLVVRIAQTIGIHRDGSHFGLSPFEVEMRRRLWWQVCILDTRASEDHGCDPTILEQSFDTKVPLNINDADISPDSRDFPPERQGCTDMSFCLLRHEMANYFRRINYVPPGRSKSGGEHISPITLEEKEQWITECHKKVEEKYLRHCDMSVPLYWVTATVARLMMSKMWLMVYHPFLRQNGGSTISNETKDKLFITSLENMEYSLLLETEARTMKWGWLFRTYVQWHALAFMLSELCRRTTGPMVERAWTAVEKNRDGRWTTNLGDELGANHLWRPLNRLYRKAKEARQRGLHQEHLAERRLVNPPIRTYSPNANPMFGHANQPRMTRAPLSQAQLRRFTEGPSFGHAPLDKHELLRSPRLSETSNEDPMDATSATFRDLTASAGSILSAQSNGMSSGVSHIGGFHNPQANNATGANSFTPALPEVGVADLDFDMSNNSNGATDIGPITGRGHNSDQSFLNESFPAADAGGGTGFRLDSLGSVDNDFSIMDTSGDLNWENWDQLVRQFGMDIDSGVGDGTGTLDANVANGGGGGVGGAVNWNNPNWEMGMNGPNLRMGMGMGGGDWF